MFQAGYVLGIFLTIFLGCLSYYTCSLVLSSSEKQPDPDDAEKVIKPEFSDFGDAIEHYLGRRLSFFGVMISLLTFLGALIAYWIFMSRFLFNVGNVIHRRYTCILWFQTLLRNVRKIKPATQNCKRTNFFSNLSFMKFLRVIAHHRKICGKMRSRRISFRWCATEARTKCRFAREPWLFSVFNLSEYLVRLAVLRRH